jgi:hypothetical protein
MIDSTSELFLYACARRGVDFSRTLMLGRQQLADQSFAEPFFRKLGAGSVESLDASEFEGATIIADLNKPLPQELRRRFTVVFDGGTLEHVFDIATALRSCLDLVELGGHYIASSPANNWPGHAFYQFSPELIFRSLSTNAGFHIRGAFAAELRRHQRWYAIPDPDFVGTRVHWRNHYRTLLVVVARRIDLIDLSTFTPQQSDYQVRWKKHDVSAIQGKTAGPTGRLKSLVWRASPTALQRLYEDSRRRQQEHFDPAVFTRVDTSRLAEHIN